MSDVRANAGIPVLAQFGGSLTPSACAPIVIDSTTGYIYTWKTGDVIVAAGAAGTVTSVAQSFTGGLISVGGSPITTSGTLALTVAGTSGGIPYFNGATTWASSGALTANAIVLGGGAGAAPAPLASLGTTTTLLHGNAAGAPTFGAIVNADITNATIDLTAKVTGVLPVANGGTNNAALTFPSGTATVAQVKTGSWTPSPTSLTVVGTPTYVGTYTRVNDRVTVNLQCTSTVSTASTLGTTFWAGLPYGVDEYSPIPAMDINLVQAIGNGALYQNDRIYSPTWTASSGVALTGTYRTTDAF